MKPVFHSFEVWLREGRLFLFLSQEGEPMGKGKSVFSKKGFTLMELLTGGGHHLDAGSPTRAPSDQIAGPGTGE